MHRSAPNFPGRLVRRSRALVPSFEPITEGTPKNRPKKAAIFHEKGANWHGDRAAANTSETRRRREPFLADNWAALCASRLPKFGVNRSGDNRDMGFLRPFLIKSRMGHFEELVKN